MAGSRQARPACLGPRGPIVDLADHRPQRRVGCDGGAWPTLPLNRLRRTAQGSGGALNLATRRADIRQYMQGLVLKAKSGHTPISGGRVGRRDWTLILDGVQGQGDNSLADDLPTSLRPADVAIQQIVKILMLQESSELFRDKAPSFRSTTISWLFIPLITGVRCPRTADTLSAARKLST